MTDMLVSCRKWRVVAFTRMTFSAPSALPAIRLGDPGVHVSHRCGKNDVDGLVVRDFQPVGVESSG